MLNKYITHLRRNRNKSKKTESQQSSRIPTQHIIMCQNIKDAKENRGRITCRDLIRNHEIKTTWKVERIKEQNNLEGRTDKGIDTKQGTVERMKESHKQNDRELDGQGSNSNEKIEGKVALNLNIWQSHATKSYFVGIFYGVQCRKKILIFLTHLIQKR